MLPKDGQINNLKNDNNNKNNWQNDVYILLLFFSKVISIYYLYIIKVYNNLFIKFVWLILITYYFNIKLKKLNPV